VNVLVVVVVVVIVPVVAAAAVVVLVVHPRTSCESTKGEKTCSSTVSLTSALVGSGWSTPRRGQFSSGEDVVVLYRRLCVPGTAWTDEENLPPPPP